MRDGGKERSDRTPRSAGEERRKVIHGEGEEGGGEKQGEGDRNRQVELFYRYLPYERGQQSRGEP